MNRGAGLIIAVAALAVLSLLVASFARLMSVERTVARLQVEQVHVRFVSHAAVEYAVAALEDTSTRDLVADPNADWYYAPRGDGTFPPLAESDDPSFEVGETSYSGTMALDGRTGRFKLRALDTAALIHVNDAHPGLERILSQLAGFLGLDPGIGTRVVGVAPYGSKPDLHRVLSGDEYEILAPYLTCHGVPDPRTLSTGLGPEPRAPIGVNTAGRHLLAAIFSGLSARNGAIASVPITPAQALSLADRIVLERSTRPFATRAEFDAFLAGPGAAAAGLTDLEVECLQVALDPNFRPQDLNHDLPHARRFDVRHIESRTTELTFRPSGIYEVDVHAEVLGQAGDIVARHGLRTVVRVTRAFRYTTQADFEAAWTASNGTWSHPEPTAVSAEGIHLGSAGVTEVAFEVMLYHPDTENRRAGVKFKDLFLDFQSSPSMPVPFASPPWTSATTGEGEVSFGGGEAQLDVDGNEEGTARISHAVGVAEPPTRLRFTAQVQPNRDIDVTFVAKIRDGATDVGYYVIHWGDNLFVPPDPSVPIEVQAFPEGEGNKAYTFDLSGIAHGGGSVTVPRGVPAAAPPPSILAGSIALGWKPSAADSQASFYAHAFGDLRYERAVHADAAMDEPDALPGETSVGTVHAGGDRFADGAYFSRTRDRVRSYASQSAAAPGGPANLADRNGYVRFWFKPDDENGAGGEVALFNGTNLASATSGIHTALSLAGGELRLMRFYFASTVPRGSPAPAVVLDRIPAGAFLRVFDPNVDAAVLAGPRPAELVEPAFTYYEVRKNVAFEAHRWVQIEFWWEDWTRCRLRVDGNGAPDLEASEADTIWSLAGDARNDFGVGPRWVDRTFNPEILPDGTFAGLEAVPSPIAGFLLDVGEDRYVAGDDPSAPVAWYDMTLTLPDLGDPVAICWTARQVESARVDVALASILLAPGEGEGAPWPPQASAGLPSVPVRVFFTRDPLVPLRETPLLEDLTFVFSTPAKVLEWSEDNVPR
ncbi:MAG: hypothetical protein HY720_23575 [Planctomycetes bacterium]|nr:hypothetical protein [Planctomycetota bacterium]